MPEEGVTGYVVYSELEAYAQNKLIDYRNMICENQTGAFYVSGCFSVKPETVYQIKGGSEENL